MNRLFCLQMRSRLSEPTVTPTPQTVIEIPATVTANKLNVRRRPGPEYDQVALLTNRQHISLIGRNADNTWVQLNASDQQWVNAKYTSIDGNSAQLPVTFSEIGDWDIAGPPIGVRAVAETVLRIKGGPGNQYRQLDNPDTLDAGAVVDIVGVSADRLFYKVNIGDRSGWINAQYVRLTGNTSAEIPVIAQSSATAANTSSTTGQTSAQASLVTTTNQCSGALPQRLYVGGQAQQTLSKDPVRVQNEPGGGTTNFLLYPGDIVDVIAGPRCQNIGNSPTSWWQIQCVNYWTGWVSEGRGSEYYFQPYGP